MSVEIGIIGLPKSGKTTIFNAISDANAHLETFGRNDSNLAVVKVPDVRIDKLSSLYNPKKTTNALVKFIDAKTENYKDLSNVDALVFTVRLFKDSNVPHPKENINPLNDAKDILQTLILEDMIKIETCLDRIGRKTDSAKSNTDPEEKKLLLKLKKELDEGSIIKNVGLTDTEKKIIRGYCFLSQKSFLIAVNTDEGQLNDDSALAEVLQYSQNEKIPVISICGKIEMEIAALPEEERPAFMESIGILESSRDKLIRAVYSHLNLVSFFTVGDDEVRAWTVRKGTPAQKAAGVIHSDIEKGFIRAEVVDYETLVRLSSWEKCKQEKLIRLEQKNYEIKDGDCVSFRFNV